MNIRTVERQIAKARMTIMGVGNVNRKLSLKNHEGRKNWRVALFGKTGEDAHRAQMNHGRLLKAKAQGQAVIKKRKIRKVEA